MRLDYYRDKDGDFLAVDESTASYYRSDLREACMRADESNKHRLFDYISWLYNYAPRGSWGSHDTVVEWMDHRREIARA